ncbi:MAG TPA: hypothetical protein VK487_01420 [Candidatus Bathyarchaeia archaeon]|nr:hypothetical protein [Candidatus Bathyarchaeia archaeon]
MSVQNWIRIGMQVDGDWLKILPKIATVAILPGLQVRRFNSIRMPKKTKQTT